MLMVAVVLQAEVLVRIQALEQLQFLEIVQEAVMLIGMEGMGLVLPDTEVLVEEEEEEEEQAVAEMEQMGERL
jgi:hypothetical protein